MEPTITKISDQENGRNRLIFRNLSANQKQLLMTGGVSAVGAFVGVGVFELLGTELISSDNIALADNPQEEVMDNTDPVIVYTEAPFAESVHDEMSFSEAFATAREETGPGGFFEWHGHTYNTYYREEWNAMDDSAQNDYLASVYDSTDLDSGVDSEVIVSHEPIEQVGEIQENEMPEPEIDLVPGDMDGDGYIDVVFVDSDGDGMIEFVEMDVDSDGNTDVYFVDLDDDNILESMIIDENQDGIQGDEILIPLEKGESIAIEDLREPYDEDSGLASDDLEDPDFQDDIDDDLLMI